MCFKHLWIYARDNVIRAHTCIKEDNAIEVQRCDIRGTKRDAFPRAHKSIYEVYKREEKTGKS